SLHTISLHDALPILACVLLDDQADRVVGEWPIRECCAQVTHPELNEPDKECRLPRARAAAQWVDRLVIDMRRATFGAQLKTVEHVAVGVAQAEAELRGRGHIGDDRAVPSDPGLQ